MALCACVSDAKLFYLCRKGIDFILPFLLQRFYLFYFGNINFALIGKSLFQPLRCLYFILSALCGLLFRK